MALKSGSSTTKGSRKPSSSKPSTSSSSSSKKKSSSGPKPAPTQHKPKPASASRKNRNKPLHTRYKESDLKLPALNGIRPAGVQKPPNRKKGKQFTDDSSMRTILALVMAEKEGNIESKMMRARQMEEIREARRAEAEKRAEGRKERFEERKEEMRSAKKRKGGSKGGAGKELEEGQVREGTAAAPKRSKKRVSFG